MLLFKDIFSGDELFTDAYRYKLVDDIIYEIVGKRETMSSGIDGVNIGANASEECDQEDEALNEQSVTEYDLVHSFHLEQTKLDKKTYTKLIKDYMKRVKADVEKRNPDRVAGFSTGVQKKVKELLGKFDDFDFYLPESRSCDSMIVLLEFRQVDGEEQPIFLYFKDGVFEEKA